MLRGVGLRGSKTGRPWTGRWSSGKGRSAAIAELIASLDLGPTARTDGTQCRPALSAESCPFTVLRLAPGTLHAGPLPFGVGSLRGTKSRAELSRRLSEGQGSWARTVGFAFLRLAHLGAQLVHMGS